MSGGAREARHAGDLYRRALGRPIQKLEQEAHHLHEVEQLGESGETPFIAILGVFLFLLPIFLVMAGLAFAAYYAFR
jgi:hypothetical protein